MPKITRKSLVFLSFNFIYSTNILVTAQPGFHNCVCNPDSIYTKNSIFETNLERTIFDLLTTNSGYGFFNASTGQNEDKVYAIALCRGDVNSINCERCVKNAMVELRQCCPDQKDGAGYSNDTRCMVEYSKDEILGRAGTVAFSITRGSSMKVMDGVGFDQDVLDLMGSLTLRAAREGPLRKYAADSMTSLTRSDYPHIYGMVQCTPELSEQECSGCLTDAVGRIAGCCSGKTGGRVLLPLCNLRYETSRFYDDALPLPPQPCPASPPGT